MKKLQLSNYGVNELGLEETQSTGGGYAYLIWLYDKMLSGPDSVFAGAQATKRTFEKHPEVFVK